MSPQPSGSKQGLVLLADYMHLILGTLHRCAFGHMGNCKSLRRVFGLGCLERGEFLAQVLAAWA